MPETIRVNLPDGRVVHFPATMAPAEIEQAIGQISAPQAPAKEPGIVDRILADNPALPPMMRATQGLARLAKANPSTAGAMAGGAIVAPFTGGMSTIPALAAIGGASALGSGAGQLASGQKPDLSEMAMQGVAGATGEGIGRGVVKLAGAVAPKLLKGILKPTRRLQDEYGDVIGTALKERVPVGRSEVAGARMKGSAAEARGMVAAAEQAGAPPVKAKELHGELRKVGETLKKRTEIGLPDESGELVSRAQAIRAQHPQGIKLTRAQELKSEAQDMASRTFRAIEQGNAIKDTTALTDKAVATGLRKAIEQRVPQVAGVNQRTQDLMGLQEALEAAEARSGGIVGLNPLNWVGGFAPALGSRAAFAMDSLSKAPLPGGLRLNLQALLAMLQGGQEPNSPE